MEKDRVIYLQIGKKLWNELPIKTLGSYNNSAQFVSCIQGFIISNVY